MRRRLFTLASALPLLLFTGCGLVWFPTIETCPNPVREVRVCDESTGKLIAQSKVSWRLVSHEYKGYPWDPGQYSISFLDRSLEASQGKGTMLGHRIGEGRFRLDNKLLLAGWQWLWPLWSWATYGDFEYHGYAAQIYADASGYAPGGITFAARLDRRTFPLYAECDGRYRLGEDGALTMFLQPLDAAASDESRDECPLVRTGRMQKARN